MTNATNRVLSNAAALVELLAARGPLSPAEIADRLGVARSSVYRLAEGTTAIGLTEFLPDSRIGSTRRFLHLADAAVRSLPEWARVQRLLDHVADETGHTAYLSVPRNDEAVCLAWSPGRGIDLLALRPGRSLPLYAGAAGRNILANQPGQAQRTLAHAPYPALTVHTLTSAEQLQRDIETSLANGFTVSDEDVTIGIGAIGAPVFRDRRLAGCLSIGGLANEIRNHATELLDVLQLAAIEFSDDSAAP
jgi:IclR family acetate operon transcriptional repressor